MDVIANGCEAIPAQTWFSKPCIEYYALEMIHRICSPISISHQGRLNMIDCRVAEYILGIAGGLLAMT